jgi:hypothetical protein
MKTVAKKQGRTKEGAEAPVTDEIRRAAERFFGSGPAARDIGALRGLLGNGLIVCDYEDSGADFDDRLLETVAAQLTVLQVFLAVGADRPAWANIPIDFDRIDFQRTAAVMVASTLALVENGPRLIDELRRTERNAESAVTS